MPSECVPPSNVENVVSRNEESEAFAGVSTNGGYRGILWGAFASPWVVAVLLYKLGLGAVVVISCNERETRTKPPAWMAAQRNHARRTAARRP
ncbi:hypothetical protein OAN61_00795 [bacterium]|nr:hypothetical protein [bacterium]